MGLGVPHGGAGWPVLGKDLLSVGFEPLGLASPRIWQKGPFSPAAAAAAQNVVLWYWQQHGKGQARVRGTPRKVVEEVCLRSGHALPSHMHPFAGSDDSGTGESHQVRTGQSWVHKHTTKW